LILITGGMFGDDAPLKKQWRLMKNLRGKSFDWFYGETLGVFCQFWRMDSFRARTNNNKIGGKYSL
jgi:hypothetical protein